MTAIIEMFVYFLLPLGAVALLMALLYGFINSNPAMLALRLRQVVGGIGLAFALLLIGTGKIVIGLPVGVVSAGLLFGWLGLSGRPKVQKSGGQASSAKSPYLDMTLDHDTGGIAGRVIAGAYAGRDLGSLSSGELRALLLELHAYDQAGQQLLEAYLDRVRRGWREEFTEAGPSDKTGNSANEPPKPSAGSMTKVEALQVLGLQSGAPDDQIRQAHRDLMKRLHPDQGGSTYLAAKINEAKDVLLGK